MKKFMRKIQDTMSAVAFAEAGEFDAARNILKGRKIVLLAVSDTFDRNAFKYAVNVSERINANLEVLYVTHSERERAGMAFLSEAEKQGFRFSLITKKGCMKKAILDYTDKRGEIQFVVVGSKPELDTACKGDERTLSSEWKRLKCPLVVISGNEALSPA